MSAERSALSGRDRLLKMGFFLTLLYTGLTILSPAELFPELAPFRIMIWIALLAIGASIPNLLDSLWIRRPSGYLMLGFIVAICLSRILNGWVGGVPGALATFLPVCLIFFLLVWNVRTISQIRALTTMLLAIALYSIVRGVISYYAGDVNSPYVVYQPIWIDESLGLRTGYLRICALGFLNDPNDFAQYLLLLLPLLLPMWRQGHLINNLFLCLFPATLLLYGIYLTNSRGALIGLALMLLFLLKDRLGGKRAALLAPLALAVVFLLNRGGRAISVHEDSAGGRVSAWSDGLGMFEHSPLWGVGFGQFTNYHEITAHNSYVLCMSELGLIGCVAWIGLIAACVLQLQQVQSSEEEGNAYRWASAFRPSLYTMLATCWFLSRTYSATLYLLLGMSVAVADLYAARQVEDLPRPRWMRATAVAVPLLTIAVYGTVRMRSA